MKCHFVFRNRVFTLFLILIAMVEISYSAIDLDEHVPMGWAVVPNDVTVEGKVMPPLDGKKVESTIGGGNGELVTVTTNADLKKYAAASQPYVILAEGSFSGLFDVSSNKTIIGAGSGATLVGGFSLGKVSNVIIRNWKISGSAADAIRLSSPHHVWVDHCDLSKCGDGLLDITNGADHVTASWTRFNDHDKTMLINNGNSGIPEDPGRLKVSLHHLFFNKTNQRHPRCGIGKVHIFNGYWVSNGAYGIHTHWEVQLVLENSYFKNVTDAVSQHKPSAVGTKDGNFLWEGYGVLKGNVFDNSKENLGAKYKDESKVYKVDDFYTYNWLLDQANDVPGIIEAEVATGAKWSKITPMPIPGQGLNGVAKNQKLKWTKVGSKLSNQLYFGTSNPPPLVATVDGYEYDPGELEAGRTYFWKINDGDLWKFRVAGSPIGEPPVSLKENSNTDRSGNASVSKPTLYGQSILIGVKKGEEQKLYDLNGSVHQEVGSTGKPALK